MSNLYIDLCETLGMNPDVAQQYPAEVRKSAFFERLAAYGIHPQNEQHAQAMLEASDRLEQKTAQYTAAADPVNQALGLILGSKQASSPADQAQAADQSRKQAAMEMVQGLLSDPLTFSSALVNLHR